MPVYSAYTTVVFFSSLDCTMRQMSKYLLEWHYLWTQSFWWVLNRCDFISRCEKKKIFYYLYVEKKVSVLSLHSWKKASFYRTVLFIENTVKVTSNDNEFRKWRWRCDKMCMVSWNQPQLHHWYSIWLRKFWRSMPFE